MWKKLRSWFRRKVLRLDRDRWNFQYASGQWEGLKADSEAPRFRATVALLTELKPKKILEIGCGEGLLQGYLSTEVYTNFVGVDISDVAIARAKHLENEYIKYISADMEVFVSDTVFEAIVFTESLYYSKNPLTTIRRYEAFLAEDGRFVVSMFVNKNIPEIWASLATHYTTLGEEITTTSQGTWVCRILSPKSK